jgi:diguanylate cyclase (GGDEF)-like protein
MAIHQAGQPSNPTGQGSGRTSARPEFLYSMLLFGTAGSVLGFAVLRDGLLPSGHGMGTAMFFVAFGLFSIAMGYVHPRIGYVSFDRVAQVAAILVLGPVAAAWTNGLASLLFPWHRLREEQPVRVVLTASLHNAGLMSLLILAGGLVYERLGGQLPLDSLGLRDVVLLLLLLVAMQALNELGMRVYMTLRDGRLPREFSVFAFVVEAGAGLGGILVAIVFNRMELAPVALLLAVLSLGMLTLTELARMRIRLEAIVAERTRKLLEKTRELERMATHDPLTGLYNRRYADEYLEQRIEEHARYRRRLAIALVDLDHFKSINDHFSHDAGDQVLKAVGAILSERCRETDMVARYGGEEFLVCFPETTAVASRQVCEQIRKAIEDTDWDRVVEGVGLTLSAGVAEMQEGMSRRDLLGAADRALYEAKSAGRNRVCFAVTLVGGSGRR